MGRDRETSKGGTERERLEDGKGKFNVGQSKYEIQKRQRNEGGGKLAYNYDGWG